MNFDKIKEAGLTQSEVALFCQVTRQTAHGWISKGKTPARVYHGKIGKLHQAVSKALTDKKLPFDPKAPRAVSSAGLSVRPELVKLVKDYMVG